VLIVEGPDGAGKTTLIASLQKRYDLPLAPRVVSKDAEAMVDLKEWVEDNVRGGPQAKIYDRHRMISEPIYGPILRHDQQPGFTSTPWMMAMMALFYKVQPIIIYCLPPLETVKENIAEDFDNRVVWHHIDQIYTAYAARAAIDWSRPNTRTVIYNYELDNVERDFGKYLDMRFGYTIDRWKALTDDR
jgi:hypothetical protein